MKNIKKSLIRTQALPEDIIRDAVNSGDDVIKRMISYIQKNIPIDIIKFLIEDGDNIVRGNLIKNQKNLTKNMIKYLIKNGDDKVRELLSIFYKELYFQLTNKKKTP